MDNCSEKKQSEAALRVEANKASQHLDRWSALYES
jgi:hypothetical protein